MFNIKNMWKFIRRLFILLVLFTIAFLVYRYISPDGASRLVDKIKSTPDTISSFFGLDQEDKIKVDSITTNISWDINLLEDEEKVDDNSWLEELNKEIESILWKNNQDDLLDEDLSLQFTGIVVEEIEPVVQPKPEPVVVPEVTSKPVVDKKPVSTKPVNSNSTKDKLTDYDYDQVDNVVGNLVK